MFTKGNNDVDRFYSSGTHWIIDLQKLDLAGGKRSFVYAHLLTTFFRCFLEAAVTDRKLRQTHLRSGLEQLFLYYGFHKDLGGILAKMGLWL